MITFKTLTIQNFLSFKEASFDLDNQGLVLIKGENKDTPGFDANGAGKCLPASTQIMDIRNGKRYSIEELYKNNKKLDLMVMGLDEDLKLRPTRVKNIFSNGKKEIIRFILWDGSSVDVSSTHPLLTDRGQLEAKELLVGDFVASPRKASINTISPFNSKEIITIASFMAEGGMTKSSYTFTNGNRELVNLVKDSLLYFNISLQQRGKDCDYFVVQNISKKTQSVLRKSIIDVLDFNGIRLTTIVKRNASKCRRLERGIGYEKLYEVSHTHNIPILKELADKLYPLYKLRSFFSSLNLHGHLSINKPFPKKLYEMSEEDIKLFLQIYWACDGYVQYGKKGNHQDISVCSASKDIVLGLQNLLKRLGIISYIRKRIIKNKYTAYNLYVTERANTILLCEILAKCPHPLKATRALQILKDLKTKRVNPNVDVIPSTIAYSIITKVRMNSGKFFPIHKKGDGFSTCKSPAYFLNHNLSRSTAKKLGKHFNSKILQQLGESDIFWQKIIRIERVSKLQDTYDLEVSNSTHLYALDNIITHNSSIPDAFLWCLWGNTLRGLKCDDIINLRVGKDCLVSLEFIDSKGNECVIKRGRKHKDVGDSVILYVNGKEWVEDVKAQDKIDAILGIDYKSFTNAFIFHNSGDRSFTGSGDADQRKVLEKLFDLGKYTSLLQIVKDKLKVLEEQCEALKRKEDNEQLYLVKLSKELESLKNQSSLFTIEHQNKIKNLIVERDALTADTFTPKLVSSMEKLVEIEDKIEQTANRILSIDDSVLKNKHKDLTEKFAVVSEKLKILSDVPSIELEISVFPDEDKLVRLKTSLSQDYSDVITECKIDISNIEKDIEKLKTESKFFLGAGCDCPTCSQPISEEFKSSCVESKTKEIADLTLTLDLYKKTLSETVRERDDKNSELILLEKKKKSFEEDLAKIARSKREELSKVLSESNLLSKEIFTIETEISALATKAEAERQKEIGSLNKEKSFIESTIREVEKSIEAVDIKKQQLTEKIKDAEEALTKNPFVSLIQTKTEEEARLSKEIVGYASQQLQVKEQIEQHLFFEKAFSRNGIPSLLMDNILPVLNEQANHYSSILSGGTLNIEFSNQTALKKGDIKEKFEVRVSNKLGASSYDGDSSGEKRRIDLCVLFALQKTAILRSRTMFNVLFIDEIFDTLDSSGVENVISMLEDEVRTFPSLFVISHNPDLADFFEKTLTIQKINGFSSVLSS